MYLIFKARQGVCQSVPSSKAQAISPTTSELSTQRSALSYDRWRPRDTSQCLNGFIPNDLCRVIRPPQLDTPSTTMATVPTVDVPSRYKIKVKSEVTLEIASGMRGFRLL